MAIKNQSELNRFLGDQIAKVINNVSAQVLELLKYNINKYAVNQPSDWYVRTGQFEQAFMLEALQQTVNKFLRRLVYDSSNMTFDPDTFTHGSPFGGDATETLVEILNKEGFTSSLNWKFSHPYWDITLKELDDGKLEGMYRTEFKNVGLTII
jgi:hypothetical protein